MFSEPVDVDTAWVPIVHPKSEADRESIKGVILGNILFASLDREQVGYSCVGGGAAHLSSVCPEGAAVRDVSLRDCERCMPYDPMCTLLA